MLYLRFSKIVFQINTVFISSSRRKSTVQKIDRVLVANRGEIACRVIRTAKKLGIRTVAIYSEPDQDALHVSMSDEAYKIGPALPSQSYLKSDKILDIAKSAKCQAIHPGYGFLSENVEFAQSCQEENIIFIGPPASAIRDMGIKSTSKKIMAQAGVPIIEGYHGGDQSTERLKTEARKIGYPVMIKAVRGGGGKGMRIVENEAEFEESLESAKIESQKSFGDSIVLLEKFVAEPRHVEVQVFADNQGNVVHLYERDCSVQRRHQKIIEEAPAPGLSNALRQELGAAATRAAKAVGYVGAGTVEFILDKNTHRFYFMEMNTRLQVEHPITEMITGTDLVEWQLKVAAGEELPLSQNEIYANGHAFEARIYAEDPKGGFLPGAGPLLYLSTPDATSDTRIETGVRQGDEVSVHYDPMIAKLVVWGNNRQEALSKLGTKLLEYNIAGLETNVNFLIDLCRHTEFIDGNVHTNFIRDHNDSLFRKESLNNIQLIQAALAIILKDRVEQIYRIDDSNGRYNPFAIEESFRVNYDHVRMVKLRANNTDHTLAVRYLRNGEYEISCDGKSPWTKVKGDIIRDSNKLLINCCINDIKYMYSMFLNEESLYIFDQYGKLQYSIPQPKFLSDDSADSFFGVMDKALSPMPGVLDRIFIKVGEKVKKGDSLFVLIAMKMEHIVKAGRDATIKEVKCKVGDNVAKDVAVVLFEEQNA